MDTTIWLIVWLVLGLAALTVGAEVLVRGASQLAVRIGISPLVVGLTVVAFGTSAPELVVSVGAALKGEADVAIGNVLGSNICNILLILGLSATIVALPVSKQLLKFDLPVMVLVSGLVWAICYDKTLSRWDGVYLAAGIVIYTIWNVLASRLKTKREAAALEAQAIADGETVEEVVHSGWVGIILNSVLVGVGLVFLAVGADWFIDSAVQIALAIGLSQLVIGLTLVAVGTSLPEIATSVIAAIRGQQDIAVGNVVGSNIFNILCVLGLSSVVSKSGVSVSAEALVRDFPIMFGVAVICIPVFVSGHRISRGEGLLFLAGYVGYTAYLVYSSQAVAG
ncbi:MAG: calcium/sodium antiporter [Planctomycetaceae bacterium]|nr:calcium/sodium antiporter [Planctomycetaceae bacterium]